MEIKGKGEVGRKTVQCPICRKGVLDMVRLHRLLEIAVD